MLIGRIGAVSPHAGQTANLDSITAVVIGGTSLFGGRGSIVGTLFGALIVGVFRNGLALSGVDVLWQDFTVGVLIIVAVTHRPVDQKGLGMTETPPRSDPHGARPRQALRPRHRARPRRFRPLSRRDPRRHRRQRRRQVDADQGASGAVIPDEGEILLDGKPVHFTRRWRRARPASRRSTRTSRCRRRCSIADNLFLGREMRKPGFFGPAVPHARPRRDAEGGAPTSSSELGLLTIQNINQAVETLSGGQRQGVAVARAAAFGSRVVIMDEPTAALGVKESRQVLELILDVKKRGLPIVLISHNMPHVFEVADRIHIHRLGRRLAVIDPKQYSMSDAVAIMTGAKAPRD